MMVVVTMMVVMMMFIVMVMMMIVCHNYLVFLLFHAAKVGKHCCNLVATAYECCFSATVLQVFVVSCMLFP